MPNSRLSTVEFLRDPKHKESRHFITPPHTMSTVHRHVKGGEGGAAREEGASQDLNW